MEIGDNLFLLFLFVLLLLISPVKNSINSQKEEEFTTKIKKDSMMVIDRKFLSTAQDSILMDAIDKIKTHD